MRSLLCSLTSIDLTLTQVHNRPRQLRRQSPERTPRNGRQHPSLPFASRFDRLAESADAALPSACGRSTTTTDGSDKGIAHRQTKGGTETDRLAVRMLSLVLRSSS